MKKLDYPVTDITDIRASRLIEELIGIDALADVYLTDLIYSVLVQDATDSASVDAIVAAHDPLVKSQLELDNEVKSQLTQHLATYDPIMVAAIDHPLATIVADIIEYLQEK